MIRTYCGNGHDVSGVKDTGGCPVCMANQPEHKMRAGVVVTYECLMSMLGLSDHKMLRLINPEAGQNNESFHIVIEGAGGWQTPEGNAVMFTDAADIRERADK